MDPQGIPVSPVSDAPPEVVEAFYRFVQQNPSLFANRPVDFSRLKSAPQQLSFRCPHCDATVLSGLEQCPQCKKPTRLTLKAGQMLRGRYRVEEQLARSGGFGSLYVVSDVQQGQIKRALKQLQHGRQVREKDRQLFEREGKLLKSFEHHAIPRLHDAFEQHGALYMVMDRIEGVTLSQWVAAKGPLTQDQTLALLPQMLEVLSYLHHRPRPVVHRDVKPNNFMLTPDQHAFLIDFGSATDPEPEAARALSNGLPEDLTAAFTRGYSAPELLLGSQPSPASDLFSLGATLLNLLTGQHPLGRYQAEPAAYRVDDLPVEPGLQAVVGRLLSLPLAQRYTDAEAVLADLVQAGYLRPNA